MEQINVGVIGSGYWGPKIIRNFHELPETNVVIVADLDEVKLKRIALTFPAVHTTTDMQELITSDEIDAIVVATPVSTHFHIAREALMHDKHVLVEKPLTASTEQARELVELARQRDLRLDLPGARVEDVGDVARRALDTLTADEVGDDRNAGTHGKPFVTDAARTPAPHAGRRPRMSRGTQLPIYADFRLSARRAVGECASGRAPPPPHRPCEPGNHVLPAARRATRGRAGSHASRPTRR